MSKSYLLSFILWLCGILIKGVQIKSTPLIWYSKLKKKSIEDNCFLKIYNLI